MSESHRKLLLLNLVVGDTEVQGAFSFSHMASAFWLHFCKINNTGWYVTCSCPHFKTCSELDTFFSFMMLWCLKPSELTDVVRSFHQDYMCINEAKVNSGHCIFFYEETHAECTAIFSFQVEWFDTFGSLYPFKSNFKIHSPCVHHWSHGMYTTHCITGSETLYSTYFLLPGKKKKSPTWIFIRYIICCGLTPFFSFLFFQNLALLVLISVESCCI